MIRRYDIITYLKRTRLEKKLEEVNKFIANVEKKVTTYSEKTPEKVRAEDAAKMDKF